MVGIYNYIEKYTRNPGGAKEGLYCYNFCLNSNKKHYQPSGAMNVNRFAEVIRNLIHMNPFESNWFICRLCM